MFGRQKRHFVETVQKKLDEGSDDRLVATITVDKGIDITQVMWVQFMCVGLKQQTDNIVIELLQWVAQLIE